MNGYASGRLPVTQRGRQFWGHPPGHSAVQSLTEHRLRDLLAEQLHGLTEVTLPLGRADVMTTDAVFEVEHWAKWREGARQVLAYAATAGPDTALALFGAATTDEVRRLYLKVRDTLPSVQLWWYWGLLLEPSGLTIGVPPDAGAATVNGTALPSPPSTRSSCSCANDPTTRIPWPCSRCAHPGCVTPSAASPARLLLPDTRRGLHPCQERLRPLRRASRMPRVRDA